MNKTAAEQKENLAKVIGYIDKMIDMELDSIKQYQKEQRDTLEEYADRGDWDNLILNALDKIKELQHDRRDHVKKWNNL